MKANIAIPEEPLSEYCRRWKIAELALFGSVLRDDFRPDSDVDVLVRFHPEARHTLFDMVRMQKELEQMLGRNVDLRTPEDLSRYFRDKVVANAKVQYAA